MCVPYWPRHPHPRTWAAALGWFRWSQRSSSQRWSCGSSRPPPRRGCPTSWWSQRFWYLEKKSEGWVREEHGEPERQFLAVAKAKGHLRWGWAAALWRCSWSWPASHGAPGASAPAAAHQSSWPSWSFLTSATTEDEVNADSFFFFFFFLVKKRRSVLRAAVHWHVRQCRTECT